MTRSWLALGVLSLGVLLIGVDATVLALAIPFIGSDLDPTATQILWMGDIFSFVLAGLLVTMGSLGDRIGHKRLLLCGVTLFGVFSVAAAYAPSAEALIGARALLGFAGATLAPSTLALIRGLFLEARARSLAVGVWASMFSAGTALGPVVGGLLLEHFWWGSVFLINIPVVVVLLVGGTVLLPEQRSSDRGPWDLPGVVLSLVGTLVLVYAAKEGAANGFRGDIVAAGVVGVLVLALFVRRQLRVPNPLIDIRMFANRTFSVVVIANLFAVLALSGVVYFLSQFFQLVLGYAPLQAGLAELPAAVGATLSGVLAGLAMRFWSQRAVLATALTLIGVAMATLTLIGPSTEYPQVGVALLIIGIGLGMAFTAASDLILASVPPERAGAAAGVSETGYELGTALGIAVLGSIIAGVYRGFGIPPGLPDEVATHAKDSLPGAVEAAMHIPEDKAVEMLSAAREAFADGLAIAAGVGSVLLLASACAIWLLLKSKPPQLPSTPDATREDMTPPVPPA